MSVLRILGTLPMGLPKCHFKIILADTGFDISTVMHSLGHSSLIASDITEITS